MFKKTDDLDFLVSVLAHEESHRLSPWQREDSLTYYLEELRAYQVGDFARYGELMTEMQLIDRAAYLFEDEIYPEMIRAWKQDPHERIPYEWQKNMASHLFFHLTEKKNVSI